MAEHSGSDVIEIEKPSKPTLKLIDSNTVEVKWITPKASGTCIPDFEIAYKELSKRHYRTENQKAGENKVLISGLKQNTKYRFKLRALYYEDDEISEWSEETEILIDRNTYDNQNSSDEEEYYDPAGESRETGNLNLNIPEILYDRKRESEETDAENQQKASKDEDNTIPSIPICTEKNGSHSLTLIWQKPSAYKKHISCFEVFCKEGTNKPYAVRTDHDGITYKVKKLKQNCKYTFRVRAVTGTDCPEEFSDLSVESKETTTNVSIASHLIKDSETEEIRKDDYTNMAVFKLKCFEVGANDTQNKIRQLIVGSGRDIGDGVDKRYVLLFGKAGSGKSTIIDLIVNHVYDVGWEDDFRLTAIDKMPDEIDRDVHLCQTQWITCYEMKRKENSMLPYDLVLIDTPGFQREDEAETERLRDRFKVLFKSGRLPGLHAICFVNQSHSGRLSSTEHYLSGILSELFGHEISQNIFIFATCADSGDSMFTRILKKVGFQYHKAFKFSNTPFTIEHQMSRSKEQENDWEKGEHEIFEFFNTLQDMQLNSFEKFSANAEKYEKLRLQYDGKRGEISDTCYSLINILNKNVIYEKIKQLSTDGTYSTICNKCKRNCCNPCIASSVNLRLCWSIYFFSGECVKCRRTKCKLSDHEYGENIYIQAPRLVQRPFGTDAVDSDILTTERENIKTKGLHLSKILKEGKELQNEMQNLTKFGERYSELDMIDSFIKEKCSRQSLDWEIFVAIFEKCKRELSLPENDRWENLDDLLVSVKETLLP